jgi:hypothetical protein
MLTIPKLSFILLTSTALLSACTPSLISSSASYTLKISGDLGNMTIFNGQSRSSIIRYNSDSLLFNVQLLPVDELPVGKISETYKIVFSSQDYNISPSSVLTKLASKSSIRVSPKNTASSEKPRFIKISAYDDKDSLLLSHILEITTAKR